MSHGAETGVATLGKMLARLGTLTLALESVTDDKAREFARELVELLLDLHGLALARALSVIANAEGGEKLTEQLADDLYIRAVLLLHGLHPQDVGSRLRDVIARMRPEWSKRGLYVDLLDAGNGCARVRLHKNGSGEAAEQLRRDVEEVLVEAAPDLDEIVIEIATAPAQETPVPM